MNLKKLIVVTAVLFQFVFISCQTPAGDIAIINGRVMDPETGTDAVKNILIRNDKIVSITSGDVTADHIIDATGLVVAPGFVDILAHIRADQGPQKFKIKDGITSVVHMHGGTVDIDGWYNSREEAGMLVNYGLAVGHTSLRRAAGQTDRYAAATPEQLEKMIKLARESFEGGAIGMGFGINYVPGSPYTEIYEMFKVCAEYGVPAHVHTRHKGSVFPGDVVLSVMEVIAAAAATGASAQVIHLASSAIGSMDYALRLIEGAYNNGVDVMADIHVYQFNRTSIESAIYDEGWEETHGGVTVDSVFIPAIGRRLESYDEFEYWRERGGSVSVYHMPYEEIVMSLQHPLVMVTSDGITTSELSHPRGAGTFSKVLGRFVREREVISLMEAIEKMTLMPARRLENADPDMKLRGRLQEGSYADITIFNPETIIDHATIFDGAQYSEGVEYVLVNGTIVLSEAEFVEDAAPGRPVRGPIKK